ncbi:MAG: L-threonylcarbamoyladenylate synthase [Bacteroidales bacterium]|jgi:L-threonylcarbamoyladenylate synthase|nr:L-threonylcarbamoyladenylate synthase [Bacteroidales bacterium]
MANDISWRDDIEPSLNVIRAGGVILYPTDTIWGLGCDAAHKEAIGKISMIKQRNEARSMIILVDSVEMMEIYCAGMPHVAYDLARLSEEPVTLVLPARKGMLPEVLLSDDSYIGIRVCREPFCSELIARFGRPVVSTSANITGTPAPRMFSEIVKAITGEADYIVRYRQNDRRVSKPSAVIRIDETGAVRILRR